MKFATLLAIFALVASVLAGTTEEGKKWLAANKEKEVH
jgi:hypothetical protein